MAYVANNTGNSSNNDWRADAFLNLYLPSENGDRVKIGAIALRATDEAQAQLLDCFRNDPEASIKEILNLLMVDFREAKASTGKKLALKGVPRDAPF